MLLTTPGFARTESFNLCSELVPRAECVRGNGVLAVQALVGASVRSDVGGIDTSSSFAVRKQWGVSIVMELPLIGCRAPGSGAHADDWLGGQHVVGPSFQLVPGQLAALASRDQSVILCEIQEKEQ